MTDKNGKLTQYSYDIHGRLISKAIGSSIISYTYDNNGNQLTITDSTGTTTRTYDEQNRVLTKAVPKFGTTTYTYDNAEGNGLYSETTTDFKNNLTKKVYDKAGRLYQVIADGKTTAYEYYGNGSRKSVTYNDGAKEEYTYYKNGLNKTLVNKKATGLIIDSYSYTYDRANNQTSKLDSKGVTNYAYDSLNRLVKTTEPSGKETSYTFDKAGNRLTETIKLGTSSVTTKYTYNEQNRLMSTVCQSGSQTVTDKYRYDNNGNTISKTSETVKPIDSTLQSKATVFKAGQSPTGENACYDEITLYEFDVWNQLIKTTVKDKRISYSYNGEGYRVSKDINGQTTNYLYEADKVILETDGANNQVAKNIYGLNLLTRTAGNDTINYMYNGHADVTALLNQEGTVTATYYYDAFGNIIEQTGNANNNITYAGYQYDGETGLYYLNARMYDPKIARFLQEDTYAGDRNDPLSLNLYTYCANNPVTYFDPTGHAVAKEGTRGDTVQAIQEKLNKLGYNVGKADGVFGEKTKAAVIKFQKDNGLTVDGIVGNQTLTEIYFEQSKQRAKANGITLPEAQKAKVGQLSGNVSIMTDAKFSQALQGINELKSKTNGGSVNTDVKDNEIVVNKVNFGSTAPTSEPVTLTPQTPVSAASSAEMSALTTKAASISSAISASDVATINASKSTNSVGGTGIDNTALKAIELACSYNTMSATDRIESLIDIGKGSNNTLVKAAVAPAIIINEPQKMAENIQAAVQFQLNIGTNYQNPELSQAFASVFTAYVAGKVLEGMNLPSKETVSTGYHVTKTEYAESIAKNGFRESAAGRAGGGGVYVNNTPEGAFAEFSKYNPPGTPNTMLTVKYNAGANVMIENPGAHIKGPLPIFGDTLTFESTQLPGTYNTIVRNGSIVIQK